MILDFESNKMLELDVTIALVRQIRDDLKTILRTMRLENAHALYNSASRMLNAVRSSKFYSPHYDDSLRAPFLAAFDKIAMLEQIESERKK